MRKAMKWLFWTLLPGWMALTGCRDERAEARLIDRAEAVFATAPDSAHVLLDSIRLPEELSGGSLLRWCELYGRVADTLYVDLPFPEPFRLAYERLRSRGTPRERARMGLYLGRAYVADKEYERAMRIYKESLKTALACGDYNQAGYICSYTADLYDYEGNYPLARVRYAEAEAYFREAGNMRSAAYALRDVGRMYVFADSAEVALPYISRADTILTAIGDSSDRAYIANALGNVYKSLGDTLLAKKYFWKAIAISDEDMAPDYCALAGIYIKGGELEKARMCLDKARELPMLNKKTPVSITYKYYKLEKAEGYLDRALAYLEAYNEMSDSIMALRNRENVIEAEKKYERAKIALENVQLKTHKLNLQILSGIFMSLCLFLLSLYFVALNRKNRKIYRQRIDLERKSNELLKLRETLSRMREELQALNAKEEHRVEYERLEREESTLFRKLVERREALLFSSAIGKKLRKLSQKVVPGTTGPLLMEKDWKAIVSIVNEIYPAFAAMLSKFTLTDVESRYCYLCLFRFDTVGEAILLNIQPDSVNKRRQRVRQKLGITGKGIDLRIYLINLL